MMTKNNKNKYFSFVKEQLSKLMVVFIAFSMFVSFSNINPTYAYFSDEATVSGNTFTAGTLAFHLDPATDFTPSSLTKGGSAPYDTTITNDGSLGFQYTASTTDLSGDADLCNYLNLQASNGAYTYNDSLSSFSAPARSYDTSAWNFVVTLPSGASDTLQDKTCNFKFTFNGWQEDLLSTEGFSDTKQISGSITSGHWAVPVNSSVVLNEILPNPEGLDTQLGLQGEWVELYNNGNTSVDLAGWKIKDSDGHEKIISSANTMNGRTIIGPKGNGLEWVVVFMNGQILNNDGDTVYFTDQLDNPIDQYSYISSSTDDDSDSNSTGGGSNSNPSGSETARNEGKSYARIPDGTGAWVDPIPTPGMPNELYEEIIPVESVVCNLDEAPVVEPAEVIPVEEDPVIEEPKQEPTVEEVKAEEPEVQVEVEVEAKVEEPAPVVEAPTIEEPVVETPAVEPAPVLPAPSE